MKHLFAYNFLARGDGIQDFCMFPLQTMEYLNQGMYLLNVDFWITGTILKIPKICEWVVYLIWFSELEVLNQSYNMKSQGSMLEIRRTGWVHSLIFSSPRVHLYIAVMFYDELLVL